MPFPRESRYPGGGSAHRDQREESGRRIRPRRRDAGAAAGPPARRSVRRKHASRGGRADPPPARSTRRPTTRPRSEAGDRRQIPETPPRLRRGAPRRHPVPLGPSVRSEVQRLKVLNGPWAQWRERRERPVLPVGARRPADKAREGGAPTGRTGPRVFRPKRNDERREATRSAGMDRRPNAAWVSSQAVWPGCIAARAPTGRTGPRDFGHGPFSAFNRSACSRAWSGSIRESSSPPRTFGRECRVSAIRWSVIRFSLKL